MMDNAVTENKVRDYFTAFGNKDVQTLCKMFDSNIHLTDSHVNCKGIVEVLQANQTIFDNCLRITPIIDDIIVDGNNVCAVIDIEIMTASNDPTKDYAEDHVTLKVVDLIQFNDKGLIERISAYKQQEYIMDERVLKEIQLARNLAREIQWVIDSGGVMPVQIRKQFDPLKKFYDECIAEENSIFY